MGNNSSLGAQGFAHGVSGIFGLGGLWDPMKGYEDKLAQAQAAQQAFVQQALMNGLQMQQQEFSQLSGLITAQNALMNEKLKLLGTEENESILQNTFQTMIIGIIVMIIVAYLIISPK